MKVQYFTFVLNPIEQRVLFENKKDKETIFKDFLSSYTPIKFKSNNVESALVKVFSHDNYAIFKLGKKEEAKIFHPPEESFQIEEIPSWPSCFLFVNFDKDPKTGHRLAVEYKTELFRDPSVQLEALSEEINAQLAMEGWIVEINAVTTQRKFWDTVTENQGKIKKLVFSFNSPNFLNLNTALSDELKEIERTYGATKTTIELENPEGKLKIPETDLINQGAEYITKGQGSYKLQVKNQKTWIRDKDNIETKEVIDIDLEGDKEIILKALDKIFNKNV